MEGVKKEWKCIESDPKIFNFVAESLGFSTSVFSFSDLYSMDIETADFIQSPVLGFILVSPDIQLKPKMEVPPGVLENVSEN